MATNETLHVVDVQELIDSQPLSMLQKLLLLLWFFVVVPYRATGVSWANGVGRAGSVMGSSLGGFLLGFGWPATTVHALVAIPVAISALAFTTLRAVPR